MGNEDESPAIVGSTWPRNRVPESARQAVLDAAAVLQVRRSEAAALVSSGTAPDIEVVARHPDINPWMMKASQTWHELFSVRPSTTTAQMRASLPNNRALLERGLRMVSIFDTHGVEPGARALLAAEPAGTYLFSIAPVQMKIVDRKFVLLHGPEIDGEPSVMAISSARCLDAAWRYWEATISASSPPDGVSTLEDLTPRQRQVVALMATGAGDEAIAASLGVSVRTVRSDIAALLDVLGVKTRFAAGVRLQLWSGQEH